MKHYCIHARRRPYTSFRIESVRVPSMIVSCLLAFGLSACGHDGGIGVAMAGSESPADVRISEAPQPGAPTPDKVSQAPASQTSTTTSTSVKAPASWTDIAIRDMRGSDGRYALNDDRLLHRTLVSPSSQYERAVLVMGRYGTSTAFTTTNPDYYAQLSWVSADSPVRTLPAWTRIILWDQIYLGEKYGAKHASGYTGNSRVRTWGYEMWIKTKSGAWHQVFKTDRKGAEAWRPTFKGGANFESYAHDLRAEPDGSYSARPMPSLGLDSSGSYWISHGYAGGRRDVNPYDVADVLVLSYSQLILHDPKGVDDRSQARFLYAVGADWLPPADRPDVKMYPSVGASRHKYVTIEPQLHVMHTMSEAEFRANPPPR